MEKLESGKSYKLTDLFKDNRHIIIPDLQRDYCWGNFKNIDGIPAELVSGFLESLISIYEEKREIKLGMIYAYEYPEGSNRIYLCDGQQRITTLFLLLGMINKQIESKKTEDFLISNFELTDDQEPRLQYSIRESTLYFLSDLVCKFFLEKDNKKVSEIKKGNTKWYFNEYNLDPTIQSMLLAMEIIEKKLAELDDLEFFAEFILNKIEFFYFDMKDRKTGEDMFVIINTTGEPLSATENIKPILIGSIDIIAERKTASDLWEKWEKWFWNNKPAAEHEADKGLNAFFVYYWQIKLLQEKQWKGRKPYDVNPFELFIQKTEIEANEENENAIKSIELTNAKSIIEIDKYFEAYIALFSDFKIDNNQNVLNSIKKLDYNESISLREMPLDILLPLIQFKIKYPNNPINKFLRRLRKNHYDGHKDWTKRRDKNNYVDWRHLIQLIEQSVSIENLFSFSDDSKFKKIQNVKNNIKNWYNDEEQLKEHLKKENKSLIEEMEDHQDFMGDISFFFFDEDLNSTKISCNELNGFFSNYKNTIDRVKNKDNSKPILVNYIRLLLLMNDCNKVGHIPNTSWDFEGVLFSNIVNKFHLLKNDIKNLCKLENDDLKIIDFCKKNILKKIKEQDVFSFDNESFSIEKLIKSWLILKVVNAESQNVCLSFHDGNNNDTGVSAYLDKDENRLINTLPFSIENSICGFGVKNPGNYVRCTAETFWLKPDVIDTPFSSIEYEPEKRTTSQIQKKEEKIMELKAIIYNWD